MARKRKTAKARGKFSDKTRAKIFAWDNGVCAMTGASLWMLDYGATSLCHYDWADHVKPRARGGSHGAENGVCVTEDANYEKSANGRANHYAYVAGQPTWKAFTTFGKIPEDTARYLRRDVQPRDWYFNRCIANLMWYVFGHVEGWTGTRIKDKPMYYPTAAFGFLEDFRKQWRVDGKEEVGPTIEHACKDWKARGLLPSPLSEDQRTILDVLDAMSPEDMERIAKKLMPCLRTNERWIERFERWAVSCEAAPGNELLKDLKRDFKVTPFVRAVIVHNVRVLGGQPVRPRDARKRPLRRRGADW